MGSMSPASKVNFLRRRASLLAEARSFFRERDILEVDTPLLYKKASIDTHIDLIPATYHAKERCYLISSPEYGMKRLLSQGIGDIYQLSHVFRDGELGRLHQPEFMMAEWYRLHFSYEQMIEETCDFIQLFTGTLPVEEITYRDALLHYAGVDYLTIESEEELTLLLTEKVERNLGVDRLTVLKDYPAKQAALAVREMRDGEEIAKRFEVYYKGVELANGYLELTDEKEQRARLTQANKERLELGKESYPIDEEFLSALKKGIPSCAGVAVGFDRLVMLHLDCDSLAEVLPLPWQP